MSATKQYLVRIAAAGKVRTAWYAPDPRWLDDETGPAEAARCTAAKANPGAECTLCTEPGQVRPVSRVASQTVVRVVAGMAEVL